MLRRSLLVILSLVLVAAVPAAASARALHPRPLASAAKAKKKKPKLPAVTSIAPRKLAIGKTLKVRGKNFRSGKSRNTVVFQRTKGGRYIFVKAGKSSTRTLYVKIPSKLTKSLSRSKGKMVATRFRLRILSSRFGAKFTTKALSPVVVPPKSTKGTTTVGGCNPNTTGDSDHDGLSNALEKKLHTDACLTDTDGDGITDFYEYESALDYNHQAHYLPNGGVLAYPGKRPYPNALDPTDANTDHDGDGLTMRDEFQAWVKYGTPGSPYLILSDGTQNSMERKPGFGYQPAGSSIDRGHVAAPAQSASAPWRLDLNGDGWLTDDERDIDGDGLTNWDEPHGRMTPDWWTAAFTDEKPYLLSKFQSTNWLDADTDGDGVKDGVDDVDHDGWANWREVDRYNANFKPGAPRPNDGRGVYGYWTQPFNPCLPDYTNRSFPDRPLDGADPKQTCSKHPPFENPWPPFDQLQDPETWCPATRATHATSPRTAGTRCTIRSSGSCRGVRRSRRPTRTRSRPPHRPA